jgi:hypothetical protein
MISDGCPASTFSDALVVHPGSGLGGQMCGPSGGGRIRGVVSATRPAGGSVAL